MTRRYSSVIVLTLLSLILVMFSQSHGFAQAKPPAQPTVKSPEVFSDGRIAFRIHAPKAETVTLSASDILGMEQTGPQFVKADNGVWEAVLGPVKPGAYRYTFMVDGVSTMDPRNPAVSESNSNAWSLVYVPGAEFMDAQKVPHGAVAAVHYYSSALGRHRRMHIYTPPGYQAGTQKYPVFYLLHGAMDCDHSWSTVGRAGFILDNLIAAGKAKPMIVVMPAGHTSSDFRIGGSTGSMVDEFREDFTRDIVPYVEAHYRVLPGRANRAIAGLSMGGMQTMDITMKDLSKYSYIGVFSSGVFGSTVSKSAPAAKPSEDWETQHQAMLDNAALKKDLKLLWFATGTEDFLIDTTRTTVEMLKKHGFSPVYKETGGGHTWTNWREYLNEIAPLLFR